MIRSINAPLTACLCWLLSRQQVLSKCLSLVRLRWKGWAASHQSPSPLAGLIHNWSQTILYCLILEPRECVTNCPSCYCCITNYPKMQWLKAAIFFFFFAHEVVVRKCLAGHLWLGVSDAAAVKCGLGCIHLRFDGTGHPSGLPPTAGSPCWGLSHAGNWSTSMWPSMVTSR